MNDVWEFNIDTNAWSLVRDNTATTSAGGRDARFARRGRRIHAFSRGVCDVTELYCVNNSATLRDRARA